MQADITVKVERANTVRLGPEVQNRLLEMLETLVAEELGAHRAPTESVAVCASWVQAALMQPHNGMIVRIDASVSVTLQTANALEATLCTKVRRLLVANSEVLELGLEPERLIVIPMITTRQSFE